MYLMFEFNNINIILYDIILYFKFIFFIGN